jgi:deoxyribonuclease-4
MRIGAHQSVAGGLELAVEAAVRDGCESLQIFTRNQNQWKARPLSPERIRRFRDAVARWGVPLQRILVHDSYLINVATGDRELRRKSIAALIDELERCGELGIPQLVMHPGAHLGQGEGVGLARAAEAISEALLATAAVGAEAAEPVSILIENTAGQGTNLGYRFEHIRELLGAVTPRERVAVCIDTQHMHAAGYDASTEEGYARTFREMDRVFGLENVRAFHINDSKRELGARVDRHERIGRGHIGRSCFRLLVNDCRFAELPGILELPPPYPPQLAQLRRMSNGGATPRRRPRARSLPALASGL